MSKLDDYESEFDSESFEYCLKKELDLETNHRRQENLPFTEVLLKLDIAVNSLRLLQSRWESLFVNYEISLTTHLFLKYLLGRINPLMKELELKRPSEIDKKYLLDLLERLSTPTSKELELAFKFSVDLPYKASSFYLLLHQFVRGD